MTFVLDDRVRESSVTTGTGPVALGGAAGGYQAFSAVMSIGDTCWYAIVLPGSAWETGIGTYTAASQLTRTTVISSSNAGSLVSFPSGSKDVFITQPAKKAQPFPAGTLMLFQQTTAPLYWTKQTTHNDKALRVVSGAASSGGTNAFSTQFGSTLAVSNTTITQSTMASHTHGHNANTQNGGSTTPGGSFPVVSTQAATINSTGGDGAHNHLIALPVQYVDLIICSKDNS
jgi:hypothetical protein